MLSKPTGALGFIGGAIVAIFAAYDLLQLLWKIRFVRVAVEALNLGGAIDFLVQHTENPGWVGWMLSPLGNPLVQIVLICLGLALLFFDRRFKARMPSYQVAGMIVCAIGFVAFFSLWVWPRGILDGYRPKTLPLQVEQRAISQYSNKELLDYTINLASQMRTFEANINLEQRQATDIDRPAGPIRKDSPELEAYNKKWNEGQRRSSEIGARKVGAFGNTYLQPALEAKVEIESRLQKIGIFREPKYRIPAFEGRLLGPDPVSEAANYIEQIARELYNRSEPASSTPSVPPQSPTVAAPAQPDKQPTMPRYTQGEADAMLASLGALDTFLKSKPIATEALSKMLNRSRGGNPIPPIITEYPAVATSLEEYAEQIKKDDAEMWRIVNDANEFVRSSLPSEQNPLSGEFPANLKYAADALRAVAQKTTDNMLAGKAIKEEQRQVYDEYFKYIDRVRSTRQTIQDKMTAIRNRPR